jgi:hypothetical protein
MKLWSNNIPAFLIDSQYIFSRDGHFFFLIQDTRASPRRVEAFAF